MDEEKELEQPAEEPSQTERILGRPPDQAEKDPVGALAAEEIPERWRPFYHRLLRTRDYLLDRETSLKDQAVEAVPKDRQQADAESATLINLRDMALARATTYNEVLIEVNEALRRIEEGTYGICELTHQPIPLPRLEAVPWTRFTKEAEQQLEQKNQAPVHFELPQADRLKGKSETLVMASSEEQKASAEQKDPEEETSGESENSV